MNTPRDVMEAAARLAGLQLGEAVGEWRWRDDMPGIVRRNANGTDTLWNPIAGKELQRELQIMLASAQQHSDGEAIVGYTVKTGALHRIIGMMAGAGFPVSIPTCGVTVVHYSFRCFSCTKEWEATTPTAGCPDCGTTNEHCAANPAGVPALDAATNGDQTPMDHKC